MRRKRPALVANALSWIAFLVLTIALRSASAQTYSVLYNFAGGTADGANPGGALIQDSDGNIYGVTGRGGPAAAGTIFKIDPSGKETMLYAFTGGADGGVPQAGLFRDPDGNLYGTTGIAGDINCQCGTVFELDTTNKLTILHQFKGSPDGARPSYSSRLVSFDGELYGVTTEGGAHCSCGVIFKISKGGVEEVVHTFTGGANSSYPESLIVDASGSLYGSTANISAGNGIIYKLNSTGSSFTILFTFTDRTDGNSPIGRLIRDVNGSIHGVTYYGGNTSACTSFGTGGCGVVFRIDPAGTEKVLHAFAGGPGGMLPFGGLVDVGGVLYGTASEGGTTTECFPAGCGLLYQIGKTGQFSVIHRFAGPNDGAFPEGELLQGHDGSIYGTTSAGGTGSCNGPTSGCGTIFKYTP